MLLPLSCSSIRRSSGKDVEGFGHTDAPVDDSRYGRDHDCRTGALKYIASDKPDMFSKYCHIAAHFFKQKGCAGIPRPFAEKKAAG
jgi:hypothetical protein